MSLLFRDDPLEEADGKKKPSYDTRPHEPGGLPLISTVCHKCGQVSPVGMGACPKCGMDLPDPDDSDGNLTEGGAAFLTVAAARAAARASFDPTKHPRGRGGRFSLSGLKKGDEFVWQGARYRHEGPNAHAKDAVNATHLFSRQVHVIPKSTEVEHAPNHNTHRTAALMAKGMSSEKPGSFGRRKSPGGERKRTTAADLLNEKAMLGGISGSRKQHYDAMVADGVDHETAMGSALRAQKLTDEEHAGAPIHYGPSFEPVSNPGMASPGGERAHAVGDSVRLKADIPMMTKRAGGHDSWALKAGTVGKVESVGKKGVDVEFPDSTYVTVQHHEIEHAGAASPGGERASNLTLLDRPRAATKEEKAVASYPQQRDMDDAARFKSGTKVVLADGRTGTINHVPRYNGEKHYGITLDDGEHTSAAHEDLTYAPEHFEKIRAKFEKAAKPVKKKDGLATYTDAGGVDHPVTIGTGIPGAWRVERGYGEWVNPAQRNPAEGAEVGFMPGHELHGKTGVVTRAGYYEGQKPGGPVPFRSGSLLFDVKVGGKTHTVTNQDVYDASLKPWVRTKPNAPDAEKMTYEYLVGHKPPANYAPGTAGYAQWMYGMSKKAGGTGSVKASEKEAMLRKIAAALVAAEDGDPESYVLMIAEAVEMREAQGEPLGLEEAGFAERAGMHVAGSLGALWDPKKHPRGRGGRFSEVLAGLRMNGHHNLGSGVMIERGRLGGYTIHHEGHQRVHRLDPESAARYALEQHDWEVRRKNPPVFQNVRHADGSIENRVMRSPGDPMSALSPGPPIQVHPEAREHVARLLSNVGYDHEAQHVTSTGELRHDNVSDLMGGEIASTLHSLADVPANGPVAEHLTNVAEDLSNEMFKRAERDHIANSDIAQRPLRAPDAPVPGHIALGRALGRAYVRSQVSKAQALVDAGLADDLEDARAQLADMGEHDSLLSPSGERSPQSDASMGAVGGVDQPMQAPGGERDLASMVQGLGSGIHLLNVGGVPFTVYYSEQGATGDNGAPVRGDKTGEYEVFAGHANSLGEPYVSLGDALARVHVSPHGSSGYGNDAAPRYAAEQVAKAIFSHVRKQFPLIRDPGEDAADRWNEGMHAPGGERRPDIRVVLSHFTNANGERVHQTQVNGMPVQRETASESEARAHAEKVVSDYTGGKIAGAGQKRVSFAEWDGDKGEHTVEPHVIDPGGVLSPGGERAADPVRYEATISHAGEPHGAAHVSEPRAHLEGHPHLTGRGAVPMGWNLGQEIPVGTKGTAYYYSTGNMGLWKFEPHEGEMGAALDEAKRVLKQHPGDAEYAGTMSPSRAYATFKDAMGREPTKDELHPQNHYMLTPIPTQAEKAAARAARSGLTPPFAGSHSPGGERDDGLTDDEHRRRVQVSLTPEQRALIPAALAKGATEQQAEMLALHGRKTFTVDADGNVRFTSRGRSYRIAPNGRSSFTLGGVLSPGGERSKATPRVTHDYMGPRVSFDVSPDDDHDHEVSLYAGEWTHRRSAMTPQMTWGPDKTTKITVGKAIDLVGDPSAVASAHLTVARALGGTKGGAMERAMHKALKERGLAVKS